MTLLSVRLPDHLVKAIRRTGRSEDEVIAEALEKTFESQLLSKEQIVEQLINKGLIQSPLSWDDDFAAAWRNRSQKEQQKLVTEMHETFFPDSSASQLISENRR